MGALRVGLAGAVVALATCFAASGGAAGQASGPKAGGTFRVAFEASFGFTDGFDPTGEYYTFSWAIESNLHDPDARRLRPRRRPGRERARARHRDVRAEADRRRHDLHLPHQARREVRAAREPPGHLGRRPLRDRADRPPEGRRGVRRSTTRSIDGFDAYGAGKAKTITGITTPNSSTIVFHLTQPTGDFLYRLAMPATGPIPVEVAKCFEGQAGKYGKDVVSTGPVHDRGRRQGRRLIVREAQADERVRRRLQPDARPQPRLRRRRPTPPAARQNLPDEFQFTIDPNVTDIVDRVGAGQLEDENAPSLPAAGARAVRHATRRRGRTCTSNPGDLVDYITMNLTQPPFDDIHVRRAMNWIMDKDALRQIWGGPLLGKIAGPHRPRLDLRQPARRVRPVRDAGRPRQPREGEGRP